MFKIKNIFIILILSFIFILNVNAESGYTTDKTGISLRDYPSTSSSESKVIATIPYGVEFYISNINAATGGGCSKGWYYVHYNNNYGYVCATIVKLVGVADTTYDRPWTTPKKAIIGGAKFMSNGYISRGQYTSYLKKFNVNPSSYYPIYNNQYMANLRAPAGEALITYSTLEKNNLLNNAFNFVIPVFNYMPQKNYSYKGLYSEFEMPTTDKTDENFENMIKDFPEDYKPYLRGIHASRPNWTFTPLLTNLNFDDVFLNEKNICSIEISSGYCENNPYRETEDGWCIATDDATKYFIDPRNFLNERYVFMFENLGGSSFYTESIIQTTLQNTFMNGNSVIDNQSYSSIFIEAGNIAKISPLYLASIAIQETAGKESNITNGAEFTYGGYTYKGLYNFFNIGAYSSEENPALAGLVYANGGRGANGAIPANPVENPTPEINNNTPSDPVKVSNDFISMLGVAKTGDYIKGYELGTTVKNIKDKVGTNANVVIKDMNGTIKNDGDKIGTGYTIEISNSAGSNAYTYVMYGDLNGDGDINSADLLKLRQHLLEMNKLTGAFLTSASLTDDSEINSADLLRIRQHLLETNSIKQ